MRDHRLGDAPRRQRGPGAVEVRLVATARGLLAFGLDVDHPPIVHDPAFVSGETGGHGRVNVNIR